VRELFNGAVMALHRQVEVRVDAEGTSKRPLMTDPSYELLGARGGVRVLQGRWTIPTDTRKVTPLFPPAARWWRRAGSE